PGSLQFSTTSLPSLVTPRYAFTATALADGSVVVAGGRNNWLNNADTLSDVEMYDPVANKFNRVADLRVDRSFHSATLLGAGIDQFKLYIAGGSSSSTLSQTTGELFDPSALPLAIANAPMPDGSTGQTYASVTL